MENDSLKYEDIEEIVSQYQFKSFNSEEPYELLTEIPDEFTRQRVTTAMRTRARECGFKATDFDKMVKAALADKKKQDAQRAAEERKQKREDALNEAESNAEQLTGLSDRLGGNAPDFGKYIVTNTSIMYVDMFGALQKICSHPIFPTLRYVNIETGSELLNISYKLDGQWKELKLIDRKLISQAKSIVALSEYGLDITSENAKEIVNYLSTVDHLNRDIIPRRETVKHLGWVDGRGFSPYIDGVDYDSGGKFEDAFRAVHVKGSFEEWKRIAGQIMDDPQCLPARIVLAASVASPLLRWTAQQPFIVHLWSSESGTGKTIATMLAASVWADPELGKYVRSMNATKVANEQLAGFCNNMPMIMDELQTVQRNTDFDDIIYMLAEGTGKARGSKDGGLREQPHWMNTIITNGEQPISTNSRAGAVNRVISIEADGEIIPGGKQAMSEFADGLRANYGNAGIKIINRILKTKGHEEAIKNEYQKTVAAMIPFVTGKQANYGAAILVGDAMLNAIIFEGKYKVLQPSDILPFLATPDMVDTNKKALEWLISFVGTNQTKFHVEGEERGAENKSELLGKITREGDVMIIKGALNKYLSLQGYVLPSFLKWCDQRHYLVTNHSRTNRHWEVHTHIDGLEVATMPVIHFKASIFKASDESD